VTTAFPSSEKTGGKARTGGGNKNERKTALARRRPYRKSEKKPTEKKTTSGGHAKVPEKRNQQLSKGASGARRLTAAGPSGREREGQLRKESTHRNQNSPLSPAPGGAQGAKKRSETQWQEKRETLQAVLNIANPDPRGG